MATDVRQRQRANAAREAVRRELGVDMSKALRGGGRNFATIVKAGGPYTGPRGGLWADPQHKIPWKGKKPGVHRHKGRWAHVPWHGDDFDGDHELAEELNDTDRRQVAARNRVADHMKQGTREFEHHRNKGDHAVVIPDASHPGKYRYSRYDERGFGGHQTFDTEEEAQRAAADAGYHKPAKGSLGKLASTKKWAQGSRDTKVMQVVNAVGGEGANAVMDFYHRHGRSDEALRTILDNRKKITRDSVPEALKKAARKLVKTLRVNADWGKYEEDQFLQNLPLPFLPDVPTPDADDEAEAPHPGQMQFDLLNEKPAWTQATLDLEKALDLDNPPAARGGEVQALADAVDIMGRMYEDRQRRMWEDVGEALEE